MRPKFEYFYAIKSTPLDITIAIGNPVVYRAVSPNIPQPTSIRLPTGNTITYADIRTYRYQETAQKIKGWEKVEKEIIAVDGAARGRHSSRTLSARLSLILSRQDRGTNPSFFTCKYYVR